VRPELLDEYIERHAAVWPDMLRALRQAGWERYSLFARPDGLIVGYLEAEDLAAAQRAITATEANTRWQLEMRRFFVSVDGQAPAGDLVLLEPIFNLDDQLAAADRRDPAPARDQVT
jgi:L-rhamnose mutarotase